MNLKYLNGIYQAKTTSLLSDDEFNALENLDNKDFFKYLKNKNYGINSDYENIDSLLEKEAIQVRKELDQLTESNLIGDVLFLNNDLNNFKIVYKSNKYDMPIENYDQVSRYSKESLVQYVKFDNKNLINDNDLKLLERVYNVSESNIKEELQTLEKNAYNYFYDKIKRKYKPLVEYIEIKNFINNLMTFLKLRTRKVGISQLNNALLHQSIFPIKEWEALYDESDEKILDKISLQYYGKLTEAVKNYFDNNDASLLDESADLVISELVQNLSYNHNDIGPIISYIYLKQKEIDKLRRLYYAR